MMSSTPDSSHHLQARKPTATQTSSGNRKTTAAGSSTTPKPPDNQQVLKCPRCDSPNTKFCYYNNYSLTQPRHFCKTCRRYWTKGGALRNVPIGGGCRKSKKNKSSTSSGLCFSTSSSNIKQDYSFDTDGSSSFKLFHGGFSPSFDQFDQFGRIPFSRLTSSISTNGLFNNNHHQLVSFGDLSSNSTPTANTPPPSVNPCFNMEPSSLSSGSSLMGFNHLGVGSSSSVFKQGGDIDQNTTTELFHGGGGGGGGLVPHPHHQDMGPMTSHHHQHNSSNLASTMESLSSINQELHWKLQQERLAMLFGGGDNHNQNTTTTHNNNIHHHHHQSKEISSTSVSSISGDLVLLDHQNQQQTQKPLPISFQNLEISRQELVGGVGNPSKKGNSDHGNEWLFDQNTYNSSSIPTTPATNNSSTWKGIQAWSDHLHNYM